MVAAVSKTQFKYNLLDLEVKAFATTVNRSHFRSAGFEAKSQPLAFFIQYYMNSQEVPNTELSQLHCQNNVNCSFILLFSENNYM